MTAQKTAGPSATEPRQRPTRLERRAAETAALANQQARLKQEAADRRHAAAQTTPAKSHKERHTTRG
jgi:hypothetical protein